jgi:hypothetical protein
MFSVEIAALTEFESAAPSHVGNAVDVLDVLAVATNVIKDQPLA